MTARISNKCDGAGTAPHTPLIGSLFRLPGKGAISAVLSKSFSTAVP